MKKQSLEEENARLKEALKQTKSELKKYKQRDKYNKEAKDSLKSELKQTKADLATEEKNSAQEEALRQAAQSELRTEDQGDIPGRRFTERFIRTVVKLYIRVQCGLRGVAEAMSVIMEEYGVGEKVSHTTVSDWLKTVGLALYKEARNDIKTSEMKYAFIIDESITIGSQKLLLVLAIPSEHPNHALTHQDVRVVGMFVAGSWNSKTVAEKLKTIIDDITYDPVYVLSDNGHDLVKATDILNLIHHRDVSHTLGILLKDTYGELPEFKEITEEMGKARLRHHLTEIAYLLPPNQRSICRFMNCFNWVEWGNCMIVKLDDPNGLNEEERLAFEFLKKHKALLKELSCVMECYKHVMEVVKNEGLSRKSYMELRNYIVKEHIYPDNLRLTGLMTKVWSYLKEEVAKLKPDEMTHNISSDIIESTFGVFKERKSPNKLYGITPFVLFIPAHAGVVGMHDCKSIDFKRIFTMYHLKDTKEWKDENLLTNWVIERQNTLNPGRKMSA